ncbi:hypothetical protein NKG05_25740 [Oerskovia sp. M15]
MADGRLGEAINPWGVEMFRTIRAVEPASDTEQSAYDRWMDQTTDREQARQARVHGAEGLIPLPCGSSCSSSRRQSSSSCCSSPTRVRAPSPSRCSWAVSRSSSPSCSACWCSSTIRTVIRSASCGRPRWSGRSSSSRRSSTRWGSRSIPVRRTGEPR